MSRRGNLFSRIQSAVQNVERGNKNPHVRAVTCERHAGISCSHNELSADLVSITQIEFLFSLDEKRVSADVQREKIELSEIETSRGKRGDAGPRGHGCTDHNHGRKHPARAKETIRVLRRLSKDADPAVRSAGEKLAA
jgi:hypothetical protein